MTELVLAPWATSSIYLKWFPPENHMVETLLLDGWEGVLITPPLGLPRVGIFPRDTLILMVWRERMGAPCRSPWQLYCLHKCLPGSIFSYQALQIHSAECVCEVINNFFYDASCHYSSRKRIRLEDSVEEMKWQYQEVARCHVPEYLCMGNNGVSGVEGSIMSPRFIYRSS